MLSLKNTKGILSQATASYQDPLRLFPKFVNELESIADHYDSFLNAINNIIVPRSSNPVQRFYALYLLLNLSDVKDDNFMSYLTFKQTLLSSIFYTAQTDLSDKIDPLKRGENFCGEDSSDELKRLGVNYTRLCYECIIHWGSRFATSSKRHSTSVYRLFSSSLEKMATKPGRFYFINSDYDISIDPVTQTVTEKKSRPTAQKFNRIDRRTKSVCMKELRNTAATLPSNNKEKEFEKNSPRFSSIAKGQGNSQLDSLTELKASEIQGFIRENFGHNRKFEC